MNEVVRSRLLVLLGLAVIGAGIAGIGTAFGVTEPLSNADSSAEFVVSEDNITVETAASSETVVTDLSNVSEITIEEADPGRFTIYTAESRPLTEAERERARAIAATNETVAGALAELETYELSVDPIRKLDTSSASQDSFDVVVESEETNGTVNIGTAADDRGAESVTIERYPSYVENRATVRIVTPGDDSGRELRYSVTVDLATETVAEITDRAEIRRDSSSVDASRDPNATDTTRQSEP